MWKTCLAFIYIFGDRSVSPIYRSWLNRLSERIAKGYNYQHYPYIMLLSSKCIFLNDSTFRIYIHVKIRFTRQYRSCNNITLDFKPLNCNKYDYFIVMYGWGLIQRWETNLRQIFILSQLLWHITINRKKIELIRRCTCISTLISMICFSFWNNIRNKSPNNDVHVKPGTTVTDWLLNPQVQNLIVNML